MKDPDELRKRIERRLGRVDSEISELESIVELDPDDRILLMRLYERREVLEWTIGEIDSVVNQSKS